MTLSRKKKAAKEARSLKRRAISLSPQHKNRKGPGGYDLDVDEAIAWFPPLNVQTSTVDAEISPHCDVLVGFADFTFWLCDVEISQEIGFYFGNITEHLPENEQYLQKGDNIGFGRQHVIRVRSVIDSERLCDRPRLSACSAPRRD